MERELQWVLRLAFAGVTIQSNDGLKGLWR
jgi:hypothetical protein